MFPVACTVAPITYVNDSIRELITIKRINKIVYSGICPNHIANIYSVSKIIGIENNNNRKNENFAPVKKSRNHRYSHYMRMISQFVDSSL